MGSPAGRGARPGGYAAGETGPGWVRAGTGPGYRDGMSDPVYIGPGGRRPRPRPLLRTLVGDVLRRNRLEQRRTLADVARDARVSVPYLSEIERGRKEASSEVLAAVCGALHIELSDLLADIGRDLTRAPVAADRATRARTTGDAAPTLRLGPAGRRPTVAPPAGLGRVARLPVDRAHRPGDVVLLAA